MSILTGTPWIYSGAIGGEGMVWPLNPPRTPCLRCLMEEPPAGGDVDTCDSLGVLGPAVGIVGSWAALEALKLLTGQEPPRRPGPLRLLAQRAAVPATCPAARCRFCTGQVTEFLNARWTLMASRLCGLEGVQIRVNPPGDLDLEALLPRLEQRTGQPWKLTPLALSGQEGGLQIMLFRDGRALLHGDITPERARGLVHRSCGMLGGMITLTHVGKQYGRIHTALADVSFQIDPGEFIFLTGPSGAGKSTLLKLLFREQVPTTGECGSPATGWAPCRSRRSRCCAARWASCSRTSS